MRTIWIGHSQKSGLELVAKDEAFTSWLRSLPSDEAEAFFSLVEHELFPPDGVAPPSENAPFEVTEEIELAFHQANMDFWRRWRELRAEDAVR